MDPLTLIGSVLLVGGALGLILYPLWQQTQARKTLHLEPTPQELLLDAELRYQAALTAIKDLMFDYEVGKVSTSDYEGLLTQRKLEAAHIRRQIDQLDLSATPTGPVALAPELEAEIESLIAQYKGEPLAENEPLLPKIEAEIASLKMMKGETNGQALACPNCAKAVSADDAFCSGCGQTLVDVQKASPATHMDCPSCGYAFQPGDAFCAQCGQALSASVDPQPHNETR